MENKIRKLIRERDTKKAIFSRQCLFTKVKLTDTWRRPRGLHSKQRKDFRAKGAHPEAGFGSPKVIRGFHPSGYREVLVFRPADLMNIDAVTTAARIGSSVGRQKRAAIQTLASSLGIKVLNLKVKEVGTTTTPICEGEKLHE